MQHAPSRRSLYLAPPFLLDDYIPRYQLLSSVDAAKKRSLAYAHLRECNLCPRLCGVNRYETTGVCLIGAESVKVNTIAPHFGEEPCFQGHNGSGSVFFSGCNLRCVFCQNHDIAHQRNGFDLTPEQLAEWFLKLQDVGRVHNINLVTPEHVVPQVCLAILHARELGLRIPIIYNTSSFDSLESIALMDGLVDIYLPDFKVWSDHTSRRLLKADGYTNVAMQSIKAMHAQVGDLCFTADGIAKKGVLVRHLVMPGKEDEGREIMKWLAENVSKDMMVHIMEQYFPRAHVGKERRGRAGQNVVEPGGAEASASTKKDIRYPDINRPVDLDEVASVKKAAEEAGLWRPRLLPSQLGHVTVSSSPKNFFPSHNTTNTQRPIDLCIAMRPSTTMDKVADIEQIVHDLKVDRDTWQAVALQYKKAFEAQTTRLQQLQDICFAAQAELENERAQHQRLQAVSDGRENHRPSALDGVEDLQPRFTLPSATVSAPTRTLYLHPHVRSSSEDSTNPLFERVQTCTTQRNYGTALLEVERLLRGPLSYRARAEGLLLKSNILRASGPDELLDALATCSEAVELCDRLSELHDFLPRIQYQRSLLCYELRLLHQAQEAFSTVSDDELLSAKSNEFHKSYDDELHLLRCTKRRSGFDENRTMEGLLAQLEDKGAENKRRRTSAQLRQRAAAKARRMSLPYRWVKSMSDGHHRE
ncbi:hypothetical protein ACET3X_002588 [Alternaria dauci]|uniref:Radical SAM core domain-containing protein n=1 Tax=Alternaria dauci TaxID=48095 RepID=A0ABR3UQ07_9PLEO